MDLGNIADSVMRQVEDAQASLSEALFEPVIRLGVTGLSGAGKTVFITSLVANLLQRGRMPQLLAQAEGRIIAAELRPHPDHATPRFDYETHLSKLLAPEPEWPTSTRHISTLRVTLKVIPQGLISGLTGARIIHLDIVDYPGEWLLDLPMLGQSYAQWSETVLSAAQSPSRSAISSDWLQTLSTVDATATLNEVHAKDIADSFTQYLAQARKAGLFGFAPGRFLMPGDLEGSPALTFAPLPRPEKFGSDSLYRAFEKRFEAYKRHVVKPFFQNHFARIDRQIVLLDAMGALHSGPQALLDLRNALEAILGAFKPGKNSWLGRILSNRVEKILFAATKADYLHHQQHPQLTALAEALVADAVSRAKFAGAQTRSLSISSLRATTEQERQVDGATLPMVIGRRAPEGTNTAFYAGDLPGNPASMLAHARTGGEDWLDQDFGLMTLAPPKLSLGSDMGPPHIRLDRAIDFLIGDKLS